MFTVTREHEICAGHRIHAHESKCAHLHGHNYRFRFTCSAPRLDQMGRVIDFAVIKDRLCNWLERNWDHKMLLYVGDPLFEIIRNLDPEGVVGVMFIPTAENLAQHMVANIAPEQLMGTGVILVRCRVDETSKCSATYHRGKKAVFEAEALGSSALED